MIKMIYSPHGQPIPDAQARAFIDSAIAHHARCDYVVYLSTTNVFSEMQLAVVEGRINYSEVLFISDDTEVGLNEYGVLDKRIPALEYQGDIAEAILRACVGRRKNRRKNGFPLCPLCGRQHDPLEYCPQ